MKTINKTPIATKVFDVIDKYGPITVTNIAKKARIYDYQATSAVKYLSRNGEIRFVDRSTGWAIN